MTNFVDFKPKIHLDAEAQLNAFIQWAKAILPKGIQTHWKWYLSSFHNC